MVGLSDVFTRVVSLFAGDRSTTDGRADALRNRNTRSFCTLCGSSGKGFAPLPKFYRQNAEKFGYVFFGRGEMTAPETYSCRRCGASDRERLYAHWLQRSLDSGQLSRSIKVIHFAPERPLWRYLTRERVFQQYETADLVRHDVDYRNIDLMQLPFSADSYDFFICSHVLEHVRDDLLSIRELWRITKPGGSGLLMAPICTGLTATIEDPDETSESERWRRFGQNDHVRLYAHDDYVRRLEAAGFQVFQHDVDHFGAEVFKALGLKPSSILYVVRKPC